MAGGTRCYSVSLSMNGIADNDGARKDFRMEKITGKRFKYNLAKPAGNRQKDFAVIFYHGWGTTADSYTELAEELADEGYTVIVPELVYHDSRNPLANCFEKEVMQAYFWKTISESIVEFEAFFQELQISKKQTVLVGSSMGGFIANGIFAAQEEIGGLVNINGSGSFLLTEKQFRKMDGRPELTAEEEHMLKRYDPVERQNFCLAPVLLMHGGMDVTIPIEGQKHYCRYLTEDGGRENVSFLIYPNVNHQFTDGMLEDLIIWLNHIERGVNSAVLE
jgi:uncharacterized protein